MAGLRATINKTSSKGKEILNQTVSAIRSSMEAGLRTTFIIGAVAMLLTFLIISTIPGISIDVLVEDNKGPYKNHRN
jgi:hypothetical protein